jgi:hypothetical protein
MWNVRRLCDRVLWMEDGRVRAYGPAADVAERYMSEVNLQALANQSTALQSHRGGSGEIRYVTVDIVDPAGQPLSVMAPGDALIVRAAYQADRAVRRPVFQVAIIDVDSGLVVTSASSDPATSPPEVAGAGVLECRFDNLPLRARQYVLRLAITDDHLMASYDQLTAGPRFAVSGRGRGVENLADEDEGLVSLPSRFSFS